MLRPNTKNNQNGRSPSYYLPNYVSSLDKSSQLDKSQRKKQVTFRDISNSIPTKTQKRQGDKSNMEIQSKSQSQKMLRKYQNWSRNQEKNQHSFKSYGNKHIHRGQSQAQRTMKNLLQNRSLLIQAPELRAKVTNQATELIKQRVKEQGEIRKCQSENKMKKFDYLGERECLNAGKYQNPMGRYMKKQDKAQTRTRYNSHDTHSYHHKNDLGGFKQSYESYESRNKVNVQRNYHPQPYVSEFQNNQSSKKYDSSSPVKKLNPEYNHKQAQNLKTLESNQRNKEIYNKTSRYDLQYQRPTQRDELMDMKKKLLEDSATNRNDRSIFHRLEALGHEEDDLSSSRIDRIHKKLDNYIEANLKMR